MIVCLCVYCRYLKSTAGNIQLINSLRSRDYDSSDKPEEKLFAFWMEFFIDANRTDFPSTQFPVSYLYSSALALTLHLLCDHSYMYILDFFDNGRNPESHRTTTHMQHVQDGMM